MAKTPGAKPKGGFKNTYLVFYNSVSAIAWLVVFFRGYFAYQRMGFTGVHGELGEFWTWTQTAALMEVFHAMFGMHSPPKPLLMAQCDRDDRRTKANEFTGIVRAPVMTTVMQVASRLLLTWGIIYPFPHLSAYPTFTTMLLAHSVTEIIRYGYFALTLSGQNPGILSWLRYNTFFVLYPLGIASECSLIYKAVGPAGDIDARLPYVLYAILAIYIPGSHILYTYMMKQRNKVMKGKATEKKIQ